MGQIPFGVVLVIGGLCATGLGVVLMRNSTKLALPPNEQFAETRWLMTGVILVIGGILAILLAAIIFYRIATGAATQ